MGAYNDAVNGYSPVHYWKLDDASGNFTDSGSSNVTLTKSGTITQNQSGGIDGSVFASFNSGAYAQGTISNTIFTDRIHTMAGWWKKGSGTITRGLFGTYRSSTAQVGLVYDGTVYARHVNDSGTGVNSSLYTPDSNWHFYAVVCNNTTMSFYVDGALVSTSAISGNITPNATFSINDSYLGGNDGSYDEVAIFNSALTGAQIRNLYLKQSSNYANSMQAKINSYTPEYFWQGDPVDAATVSWYTAGTGTDSTTWARTTTSPSGNITRVSSTLPTAMPGAYMLSVPYASRYRTNATVYGSTEVTDLDFVIGVWFKMNTGTSNSSALTKILGSTGSMFNIDMRSQTSTTAPGCVFWSCAGTAQNGTIRVDDGNWHFLAIRKVSGDNNYRCYVDGVLDTTVTTASSMTAGNWQVGDSTQGSGSATLYVDNFFMAPSANVTAQNLLDIYNFAVPAATNGGYTAQVMTVTTSTFPDPAISVQKNNSVAADPMNVTTAVIVDPVVSTDLSYEFNATPLVVTDSTLVGPSIQTDASTEVSAAEMTASSEFPQPTLSITLDMTWYSTSMDASSEFGTDPAISTDGIILVDPMTAETIDTMASIILDDGYTAIPAIADASFSLVDPVVTAESSTTFNASPATASATSGTHKRLNLWVVYPDKDVTGSAQSISAVTDSTILEVTRLAQPERASGIKFTIPSFINSGNLNNITKVALELTSAAISDGTTFVLSGFVNDWEESGVYNLISLVNPQLQIGVTFANTNTTIEIDDTYITSANPVGSTLKTFISQWVNGTNPNYGFRLVNNGQPNTEYYFHSSEAGIVAYRPKLIIYGDFGPMEVNFQPAPMTASALMSDPNIIAGQSDDNLADPLLASADKVMPAISAGTGVIVALTPADHLEAFGELIAQPSITTEQGVIAFQNGPMDANAQFEHPLVAASGLDATIDTAPFNANASLPMPGIRQDDGAVANTMVAFNADFVDPSVAADTIELVFAEPMLMRFAFLPPEEAVDETSDPYYQEILKTTNLYDSAWYRLDEISGSTVVSKTKEINAANLQQDASFVGVPVFGNVGPRLRKTITFTGSQYITIPNPFGATGTSGNIDWLGAATTQVSEITLKTIQTKGTIFYGTDANTLAGAGNPQFWMLDLVDGRLRFRSGTEFRGVNLVVPNGVVIGNKQINDGEFHHIVIQLGNTINGKQLEIYVDGQLDIARFNAPAGLGAHPDFIAGDGRPTKLFAYNTISYVPGNLEETPYFAGEIMEYVFRPNVTLTDHQIQQLFYRALDIDLKQFPTVTATATMPEPIVSGNKPRALVLSFWPYNRAQNPGQPFDENLEVTHEAGGFDPDAFDVWEYYVNRVSANPQKTFIGQKPDVNVSSPLHRDPVTDDVRLLDPRTIPNIARYDIIQINGYPLDSNDVSNLLVGYDDGNYQANLKRLEDFVDQVREIVDNYGTSLLVTNPRLAVDLGIVDDVEYMDPFFDTVYTGGQTRQNSGIFDPRSAQINLQDNFGSLPSIGTVNANGWWDTHGNNRLRITATQAGLTDIPNTWMLQEVTNFVPGDPLQIERTSYKYKDIRNTGLIIGDSMPIINRQISPNESFGNSGNAYNRVPSNQPIIAFPPNSVKAGTVIARMGTTYWDQATERANPYADYVAAIVVNPGANVKGKTLGGKIYVGCAEWIDTSYANMATFQTTNGDANNPIIPDNSTWQYSGFRLSTTGTQVGAGADQVTVTPGQAQARAGQRTTTILDSAGNPYTVSYSSSQLFSILVEEQYPTVNVWAPSLLERAIYWLADRPEVNPSDKTVRPQAFIAEIEMIDSGLIVNRDISVSAVSMISNADIVEPDEVNAVDANIVTLPLTATALINGYSRQVAAPVMTATATITGNSITFAGGEQVVVTLHELPMVEVFIKEDTY